MMNEVKKSRFDLSAIGEADKRNLCATFLEAALEFYEDPKNCEQWKRAATISDEKMGRMLRESSGENSSCHAAAPAAIDNSEKLDYGAGR